MNGKDVSIKLMSLRDVDMVKRTTAKLVNEGYSEDIAAVVANVMHGVTDDAWFPLTAEGILDVPAIHLMPLVEAIVEHNSPLEEPQTQGDVSSG